MLLDIRYRYIIYIHTRVNSRAGCVRVEETKGGDSNPTNQRGKLRMQTSCTK